MAKVKICGITNFEDASRAVSLGADFIGFNFCRKSKRYVAVNTAAEIISKLPPVFVSVGVFVDEEQENILQIVQKCSLKVVQLHGKETPEFCTEFKAKLEPLNVQIIKVFKIKGEGTLKYVSRYRDITDYFLLDTYVEGEPGGTGEVFNWDIAVEAKKYNKPIFLAGGLKPDNVKEAIKKVEPFAVDVASGVERLPRRKDFDLLKNFIVNVKL